MYASQTVPASMALGFSAFSPCRCTSGTLRWWLHRCSAARPAPASASVGCLQSTHMILMLWLADSSFDRDQIQEHLGCAPEVLHRHRVT